MSKIESVASQRIVSTAPSTPDAGYAKLYKRAGVWYELDENGNENYLVRGNELPPLQFSGRFLSDPNEINGWGVLGAYDNTNSQDLGNVSAANLSRLSGGPMWPYQVKITGLYAYHRDSNSATDIIEPWGWAMLRQKKTGGTNTITDEYILDEVADNGGVGPRAYGNSVTQETMIDLSSAANNVLSPFETLVLGLAAPTATPVNRYVEVMSGIITMERV